MTHYRLLVVASLLLVSLGTVPAGATGAPACSLQPADLRSLVDAVNENVDEVPGFARGQFGGERIEVSVETAGSERYFALETTDSARITRFESGPADDPTLLVETSKSTFCAVVTADDPKARFADAYYGGEVEVSGVGTVNSVKVEAVKVGVSVTRVLSGLFGLA